MSARTNCLDSPTKVDTPAVTGGHVAIPAAVTDDPLFRSVEAALRFAYRMEASDIIKVSSLFRQMRGSTVRGKRRSDGPWDDHAQGAMILALTDRTLRPPLMVCVRCYYTQPSSALLDMRKQMDYRLLAELFRETEKTNIDQWFVADVVRGWAGDRRHHQDAWWASHLGLHPKKIQRFINGRRDRGWTGIMPFLSGLNADAHSDLWGPMVDAGLVRED